MNAIGFAMLHVTRTAAIDPRAPVTQPAGLGLGLAAWLGRVLGRIGVVGRR